jgi:hypothetical protein
MDETWLCNYDSETKQQSMEWQHSGSPCPPKISSTKICWKILASIFWDQDGILVIDYLPKGQTIDEDYYLSLLVQLKDRTFRRRGKFTKGTLFVHDNTPAHWTLATQKRLAYQGFQCLDNLPYSPDQAPSDYRLFPGLNKKQYKFSHFSSKTEVIFAAETWLDGQISDFFEWLTRGRTTG